jgi:ribose-phosphate pyrophosphokinase
MTMFQDLKIFSGSSHPALAQRICERLGVPLCQSRILRFTNENIKVKIEENVRDADTFVVQTSCPPVSENLIELLIFIDALKYASAGRITAVLPYYPYVRSDKKDEPRISISARLIADLLQTAGAHRVLALDLHSPQIHGFFHIPVDHLTATGVLCEHFVSRGLADWVLVAPDAGEAKDAGRYAKRLDIPLVIIDKRRYADDEKAKAIQVIGEVAGKHALVIDDEVATAGTLVETVRILTEHGAQDVSAGVVHPVLSGPAAQRVRESSLRKVVVTDSVPIPAEKMCDKIQVLTVAPLFAQAIERIHDGRSVSSLF